MPRERIIWPQRNRDTNMRALATSSPVNEHSATLIFLVPQPFHYNSLDVLPIAWMSTEVCEGFAL